MGTPVFLLKSLKTSWYGFLFVNCGGENWVGEINKELYYFFRVGWRSDRIPYLLILGFILIHGVGNTSLLFIIISSVLFLQSWKGEK